ncbi:hypothetical protein CWM88_24100 [Klebsiella pneumoniae]|nr:hypothetical protein CWM88_24100 [Klebsiella pneumoniae]
MLLIMDTYIQMKLTINPATRRGFCFPAIRQGYSRDALHHYPCHIIVLQTKPESLGTRRGFFVSAIRSGLLG